MVSCSRRGSGSECRAYLPLSNQQSKTSDTWRRVPFPQMDGMGGGGGGGGGGLHLRFDLRGTK